jgi:hypothetical protein
MALTRRQKKPSVYAGCPVYVSTGGISVTEKNTALTG